MTVVGHSLMGIALGTLAMPTRWSRLAKPAMLGAFAFLAMWPDIVGHVPQNVAAYLPGKLDYITRHSLVFNGVCVAVPLLVLTLKPRWRNRIGGRPVVWLGVAAVFSHLLLDTFYNHGRGLIMIWPFGQGPPKYWWSLKLPMPWFQTRPPETPWPTAIRIWTVEACFYGGVVMTAILARRLVLKRRAAHRGAMAA